MPQNKRNHIGSQKKGEKIDCAKIKIIKIHVENKDTQNGMIILYPTVLVTEGKNNKSDVWTLWSEIVL